MRSIRILRWTLLASSLLGAAAFGCSSSDDTAPATTPSPSTSTQPTEPPLGQHAPADTSNAPDTSHGTDSGVDSNPPIDASHGDASAQDGSVAYASIDDASVTDASVTDASVDAGDASTFAMAPLKTQIDPQIAATLADAGLDPANLPPFDAVVADRPKRSAVMKTFTMALGTDCTGCHQPGAQGRPDFSVDTPEMAIAAGMWDKFVRGFNGPNGPIYCDSCHQGKKEFLDRSNDKALKGWMKDNFVGKLTRKDGQATNCATCHGDPFKGEFLDDWVPPPNP